MLARLVVLGLACAVAPARAQPDAPGPCLPASVQAVADAARLSDDGDPVAAEARLRPAFDADQRCRALAVAYWATLGTLAASRASARGGPVDLLAPVTGAIAELEMVAFRDGRLSEAEYARGALLAARAAAQDERDEMRVWLTHARAVASRLAGIGRPPRWPATIDMLDGALWFEVDRFAEASDAFERVAADADTVAAWVGLARARERLSRHEGACAAWQAAAALVDERRVEGAGAAEVRAGLATCQQ